MVPCCMPHCCTPTAVNHTLVRAGNSRYGMCFSFHLVAVSSFYLPRFVLEFGLRHFRGDSIPVRVIQSCPKVPCSDLVSRGVLVASLSPLRAVRYSAKRAVFRDPGRMTFPPRRLSRPSRTSSCATCRTTGATSPRSECLVDIHGVREGLCRSNSQYCIILVQVDRRVIRNDALHARPFRVIPPYPPPPHHHSILDARVLLLPALFRALLVIRQLAGPGPHPG